MPSIINVLQRNATPLNQAFPGQTVGQNIRSAPGSIETAYSSPQSGPPAPVYRDAFGGTHSSQAEADARNAIFNQARSAEQQAVSGSRSGVNQLEGAYQDKVLPFAQTYETGQQGINQGRVNNALSLRRTTQQIGQGVRQGIKSGGVYLANANALDSSASGALAKAYARQGGMQLNQASNQAALKGQEYDTTQANLERQKNDTLRSLSLFRNNEVDRIGRELEAKLQAVEQDAAGKGATGFLNVLEQKNSVTNDAYARLDRLDQVLKDRMAAAKSLTPEQINAQSVQADQAGAAANPFDYNPTTVIAPGGVPQTQIQPLSIAPRKQDEPLAIA